MEINISVKAEKLKEIIKDGSLMDLIDRCSFGGCEPDAGPKAEAAPTAAPNEDAAPTEQVDLEPPAVPTETRGYSRDEITKAAMQLMDQGKQPELLELLQEFGVRAVPQLPQDAIGKFAVRLREMGAQI